jgi:anti-sigma regulatory factor (Ser/Thr protein kinase)
MIEFTIEARPENLDAVQDFISRHLEDCPPKIQSQIAIAVDEIFSNIAHYAYSPEVGGAVVRVAVDEFITIEVEDSGKAYNPLHAKNPDIELPAEEREIGGLGIFMVKKMMDSVEYRRDGDRNIFTVRKKAVL